MAFPPKYWSGAMIMIQTRIKIFLITCLTVISLPSFSDGGFMGFVRSFSLFGKVNEPQESLINQCHRERLDPQLETHAQCAEQLCRQSKSTSIYLSNSSIEDRLQDSEEASNEFSKLEEKLVENLRGLERNQRSLMAFASTKKQELVSQVDNLSTEDFQSLANRVLGPYVSDYRWDTGSEAPFIYVPERFVGQKRVALEEFGQRAWAMKDSFPTAIITTQTVDQQRQTAIAALNNALEVSKNNPEPATGDVKFIDSYIEGQLELVSQLQGQELESLLLESERKLKNFFAIKADLSLVNHAALNFCSSESCKSLVKELVSEELEDKINAATSRPSDDVVREALAVCQSQFFSTYLDPVSDAQARQKYEEVLNDFVNNGLASISSSSKRTFKQYALAQVVRAQSQNTGNSREAIAHFERQRNPPEFDVTKFFSEDEKLFKTLTGLSDSLITNRFDVNSICPEDLVNVGTGSFVSPSQSGDGQARIQVGQGVSHHFSQSKQIISREMAHLLADSLDKINWSEDSKRELVVMRNCSVQSYGPGLGESVGQEYSLFDNDNFTTQEDFADLLAFRTYQSEAELFSCGLFKDVSNSPDLNDYHLILSSSESRASTPFFRLLQEAIHKNKNLPSVCTNIIQENSDRIGAQSCF